MRQSLYILYYVNRLGESRVRSIFAFDIDKASSEAAAYCRARRFKYNTLKKAG